MNAESPHDGGLDPAESGERAEAARLLPAPAAPDLLDDRLRVLKEHLMSEIHQTAPAAGPGAAAPEAAPAPRRRKRRWVPVVAPLAAAAVVAAVLTAAPGRHGAGSARPAPSRATLLLESAADVVSRGPAVHVGHDRFVYVHTEVAGRGNPVLAQWYDKQGHVHRQYAKVAEKLTKPQSVREWIPWSRSRAGAQAWGAKAPERLVFPAPGDGLAGNAMHLLSTLDALAALPQDPAEALQAIEAQISRQMDNAENTKAGHHPAVDRQMLFEYMGGMFQESVDPRTTAFLYRVAAQVPGTTVIPDAVDAAGRHGVAVGVDGRSDDREEWIFDKSTYAFLGLRDVTRHDTVIGKAGSVILVTAALGRAVVDHAGDMPRETTG